MTKSHTFFSQGHQRRPTGCAQGSWATARQRGGGVETTGPVPDHWVVQDTAAMSPAEISAASSEERAAKTTALHQSSGSCSAPPPGRRQSPVGSKSWDRIRPCDVATATFAPEVPRSMASTYLSAHPAKSLLPSTGTSTGTPRLPPRAIHAAQSITEPYKICHDASTQDQAMR